MPGEVCSTSMIRSLPTSELIVVTHANTGDDVRASVGVHEMLRCQAPVNGSRMTFHHVRQLLAVLSDARPLSAELMAAFVRAIVKPRIFMRGRGDDGAQARAPDRGRGAARRAGRRSAPPAQR